MYEQSKSAKRRFYDGNFISKYFVGNGIDIGCGPDSIARYMHAFPMITSVTPWDVEQGDAQILESIKDETFDFVHASHSLEHMVDPYIALNNWVRILKPNGHLIITVPDEDLYEQGIWPSQFNPDHKWSFTIFKSESTMPKSINITSLISRLSSSLTCIKVQLIDDFVNPALPIDQTLLPNAECAIEFICRKS